MIEEVIGNIIEAETKADAIIKASQSEAKEMITKAKEISVVAIEEEKKRVEIDLQNEYNNALAKAKEIAREKLASTEAEADALNKKAEKNVDKSIEYIVGRMTAKYDM